MGLEAVVEGIIQPILQVEDEGVAVDFLNRLHYEHFPLAHGIIDGLHGCTLGEHQLPHLGRCHHILAFPVHTSLIEEKAAGRIEGVHILGQMVRQQAGKEPQAAALSHFVPLRQAVFLRSLPGFLLGGIRLVQLLLVGGQRLGIRRFQAEMLPQLILHKGPSIQWLDIIQGLPDKLLGRPHIFHRGFLRRHQGEGLPQFVQRQRQVAQGCRGFAGAGAVFLFRAGKALLCNGLAGDGLGAALQEMLDFLLRFCCPVPRIKGGQFMDGPLAALKNRQIGNHGVPVMFREDGPIVPAMPDEVTAFQDQRKALLRPFGRWPGRRGGFLGNLRQVLFQLGLRIAKLRVKMDTLHHDRLLLAMVEARQTKHPAFIDAGSVPMKLSHEALLYPAEGCHVPILDKPVSMQGFPGFHNERGFQRERFNLFKLLVQRQLVALHKLRVDPGDLAVLMAAEVHHKIDAPVFLVVLFQGIYQARQAGEGCFQLGPFEGAGFSIVKNPQADALARPEERAEKFFQRDIQCFPHFRTTSTHRSVKYRTGRPRSWAFSISTAMPFVILPPNTHTSLHLLCKTIPKKMPRRRCCGSLSSMN